MPNGSLRQWSVIWLPLFLLHGLGTVPARAQGKIVLDGATGVLPLGRALVSAYLELKPEARIDVGSGLGTRERLRALAEGSIQVAVASHGITSEDVRVGKLTIVPVARGAIVFAVNETVSISNISEQQVCDIYSGKIVGWGALGGGDHLVVPLTRPASEVDPEVIRAKLSCFTDLKEVATARILPRGGDMARALAETAHALGMTSMTVVAQSGGKIKALSLNGMAPTLENIQSGRYVLTRDFLFVIRGVPTGATRQFLDFVRSPDGDRVILANGAIPVR